MFQRVEEARFLQGEHEVLRFWDLHQVFQKLREKNRGKPKWSFLDGPITANNPMGVHHAWGRTYKDAFQRYYAMTGHELRHQNGFDCQGLWVEVEVEKQLKLGTKKAIEEFGIDVFTRECKQRVLRFAARQTEQSIRLGYWMEWDRPDELVKLAEAISEQQASADTAPSNVTYTTARGQTVSEPAEQIVAKLGNPEWGGSYFTFSTENNETIWTFLKKCFERNKVYRGHDVMPWSGRGGSAYSQMEVADGRKLTTHRSCFVRFPLIVDQEDGTTEARRHGEEQLKEYLLVWTTTPWTLTSNVAAAVNPDLEYVRVKAKIKGDDEPAIYYFAKENLNYKRLEKEFKEGFGRPEWGWPEGVGKLKSIAQIFKEQGGFEELGTLKGAEMVGWRYAGPFDDLEAQQRRDTPDLAGTPISGVDAHRVIDGGRDSKGSPNVVAGEGTGIVHIAPGCGDIDHKIGVELGLPVIAPLRSDGTYSEGFGEFTGREAIDPSTADMIFEDLKQKGLLVYVETYPHIYPFCWRTGDELVFRLVDEWFINMDWRDEIKDVTRCINWLPKEIQGQERELEWLNTMRDWMISKKRFWGLALPIWVNPDDPGDFEVIGSLAELKDRAVEGWDEFEGHTPHRPWIDKVKIKSTKTGAVLTRVEDVGNPWLDAGIVPFSTLGYKQWKENSEHASSASASNPLSDASDADHPPLDPQPTTLHWPDWYPADLVLECFPGQFRNWFYSMLSLSTMMRYDETEDPQKKKPFKNLFGHRLVMNEEGKPMHKSDGTAIWFEEAAEQLGVDTLRWMYLAQNPAVDLKFGLRHPDQLVTLETVDGPISETKEGLPTCKVTSKPADEIRRQVLIPLWNSYAFFANYAVLDGFDPSLPQVPPAERAEIDRWILSRLQELIGTAHTAFQGFQILDFMQAATEFIDDLSNWYIRRNRRRFWKARAESTAAEAPSLSPMPLNTAEEKYRVFLSTQKLGLNRERMTLLREVFAEPGSFTVEELLVRLSRYHEGKKLHRADVLRGLRQLVEASVIEIVSGNDDEFPQATFAVISVPNAETNAWDEDKLSAYQTLYEVLLTTSKLLAPCVPFLSERMYQNLVQAPGAGGQSDSSTPGHQQSSTSNPPISVHLCDYPQVDSTLLDPDLNWKTHQVQMLVRMGHRLRETAEQRVRQPLAELRFASSDPRQAEAILQYRDIIADELNVKQIVHAMNLDELVSYSFKPNLKTLGPKYGKLLNVIRTQLQSIDPQQLAPLRSGTAVTITIDGQAVTLEPEDVMVSVEQASDWASADDGGIQIALSTRLTPELIQEGMARDLIRHVQQLRKDAALEENQRILIAWNGRTESAAETVGSMISVWQEVLCTETRADSIVFSPTEMETGKQVMLGDQEILLRISPR